MAALTDAEIDRGIALAKDGGNDGAEWLERHALAALLELKRHRAAAKEDVATYGRCPGCGFGPLRGEPCPRCNDARCLGCGELHSVAKTRRGYCAACGEPVAEGA